MATKKKSPLKKTITKPPQVDLIVYDENVIPPINKLIDDDMLMKRACELASTGASVSSLAAMLKIPAPTFRKWISDGQALHITDPGAPEAILYERLAESWGIARILAEAALAQTKPEFFLTRGPGKLLGDDWIEQKGTTQTEDQNKLHIGAEIIESFKLLREQGIDLNDIIDNDKLELIGVAPPAKTLLEEKGIDKKVTSLPGKLRQDAAILEQTLDLTYGTDRGLSNG
jgi:hypothetical protein